MQNTEDAKHAVDANLFRLGCQSWSVRGASGRRCRGGGGGLAKPPAQNKNFKSLLSPATKNTKLIISQKLRIAQKKSFTQKMSARLIPIYPESLVTFEKNYNFGAPRGRDIDARGVQTRYQILRSSIFFSTLYIFYAEIATSEGWGGGLPIGSWETTKFLNSSQNNSQNNSLQMSSTKSTMSQKLKTTQ